ncbi:MAG: questin oxidase family protein [Nocardioides sp.]
MSIDDAYERLHRTGPEFDGTMSNHGPMAVEAMVRHGHEHAVARWVDGYSRRLDEAPRAADRITEETWRDALGDRRRLGDWPVWFAERLAEQPWTDVLATWWPRLLPGIAAGATHGVIRTGHVIRALREDGPTPIRLEELAQALGYWAARWLPVPAATVPSGQVALGTALTLVPTVPEQYGGISHRLAQLTATPGWTEAQRRVSAPASPVEAEPWLTALVAASVQRYATHAHGNPIMLVHAATAPNAVLRALPSLPRALWVPSAVTAWSASAAVHAAYATDDGIAPPRPDADRDELFSRAVDHGDEHVIKLADTALDVHAWSGDPIALSAVLRALDGIGAA